MQPGSQTISPDVAFESPHDQKPDRVRTGVSTIRERRSVRERVGWRGLSRYLRRILVVGAHSVLRRARQNPEKYPWLTQLLARRPFKVVAIALANKMARIAWALLARDGTYRVPALAAA